MRHGTGSTGDDAAGAAGAARCPYTAQTALSPQQDGDPGLARGEEPPWDQLRSRHGGLVSVEVSPGVPGWLLLGYKENLQVLRDQTHFSADPRPWDASGAAPVRGAALNRDGDDHQRLRQPIVDALASVGTQQLVPVVQRAAVHLIGRVESAGAADLIGQYAAPLPALALNELLGLPDSYGHLLADLSARLWSGDQKGAATAAPAVRAYFRGLVARKRAEPGRDLTSSILEHPHGLTDEEAVEALHLLWAAGHEPTTHLIGNALLRLIEDPGVWTAYLGGTLTPEDFVDYVMWTEPPVSVLAGRYATTDMRFAGARIRRGEPLLFGFGSAHTDPSVSGDTADSVALLAGNRAHLSWGAGAHRCPATAFTRELVRTAIDTALDRMRGMVMAVEPAELRWRPAPGVHGLVELPVWFTPTGEREQSGARPEPREPVVRRRSRRRTRLPAAQGARYQAPFAEKPHVPDPLEQLLETWNPRA
ncbi:cytochrome P450 [Nocardiopsis sp. L17-MgMaSL7]|uniref:cytochrome P450 n=1 Tax=Nocardiopsis sp. L17-MgMaSL7 TaxID=1938893 RepID=UPI000D7131F2|nr:cytochrome P450 [Nocardiopsis sp. L17-MgMaSL7]PWV44482.1 cytochrome P450 [Nocardiopsis sp. L17-MgMaSL7]